MKEEPRCREWMETAPWAREAEWDADSVLDAGMSVPDTEMEEAAGTEEAPDAEPDRAVDAAAAWAAECTGCPAEPPF